MVFNHRLGLKGFTLVELVVALALGVLTIGAIYGVYVRELSAQAVREDRLDMHQQARVVMDLMSRELVMAGYDPSGVNRDEESTNDFWGITFDPDRLIIKADLNGNGRIADPNESIIYSLDSRTHTLRRNTGGGNQPFGENIENFSVQFFNDRGIATTESSAIKGVHISVTARTSKPDPTFLNNGGYRTITLQSRMAPRNL